ncbi:N-acetylglucosamine-6-phosphate deacetylase [Bacillus sp. CBEL-1]|uniref:N-acetylglucosamine-6-phosphate deacetylase n=1 Tax=Bacillus sp. CBEL-1 TaxID=2502980 RepID=UPI001050949D|nr:N-acetylglucosamine-6-phosphate deacetylase [Bacillus sp. CBEL-1]TDB55399.1 N-acetylglucosamine-6-phosphate deacetylase [Bacillus sp. CBEL-1]
MNKPLVIYNVTVYGETIVYPNGYLKIENGSITELGSIHDYQRSSDDQVIEYSPDFIVVPGAIDIHIHGAANADAMDAAEQALQTMAATLPKEGTTSFLPTTMTQSVEAINDALIVCGDFVTNNQNDAQAEAIGIHLEGPFISAKRAGAQPLHHIQQPSVEQFKRWQELAQNHIRLVTLAPEESGGTDLVKHLKETNVVASIGHSDATYEEVDAAIQAGASHVTHLYNGMRGIHHREPGVLGASYLRKELYTELIVDGIHSRKEMVKLAYEQISSERLILITDSLRAKWLKSGIYDLGGQSVQVNETMATLADGTLAGSILKMNEAMKNMMEFTGCSIPEIIQMASVNPAKQIGVFDRKGSLKVGKDGDCVVMNKHFDVQLTVCRGHIAYKQEEQS